MYGCVSEPLHDHIKIMLLIPELEGRLRRMYLYLRVVLVAFQKCNPVCFIFVPKGSQYLLSLCNHKNFSFGNRSAVYQADLCPCRYVPVLWKKPVAVSDTAASGKMNSTDGAKHGFSFLLYSPGFRRGRQANPKEYRRKSLLFPCSHLLLSLNRSIAPVNRERNGRFSSRKLSLKPLRSKQRFKRVLIGKLSSCSIRWHFWGLKTLVWFVRAFSHWGK